ncbi:putative sensory transduction histidine kinase [Corchorus olitorius]|uniref:Sensory transduction histidine kinase n=1 Tax=Corchorus olitorius TaxID=93759 RepID=A0A1R3K9B8_9ROSI|nr:putative sensory transduction histidine kinase [Corchorus olitorius]
MGKDLDIGMPRNVDIQVDRPVEVPFKTVGTNQVNLLEMGSTKFNEQMDKRQLDLNCESPSSKVKSEAANQTGITSKTSDLQKESAEYEASNRLSKISDNNDKAINDPKELASIELGLKRLRGVKDTGIAVRDERNVLRRSDSSAFSRYNTASNASKIPIKTGNSSALDINSEVTRKGSVCDARSHLINDPPNQCSNVGSNNIDMGSTTNNVFAKPAVLKNKSAASSSVRSINPSSTFQPIKIDLLSASQKVALDNADDVNTTAVLAQPSGTHKELQMQHLPNHYDHHHHIAHGMQQQQQPPEHDDSSLKRMAADVPHCGSSNVLGGPIEGNAGNYSVNGSASGSVPKQEKTSRTTTSDSRAIRTTSSEQQGPSLRGQFMRQIVNRKTSRTKR